MVVAAKPDSNPAGALFNRRRAWIVCVLIAAVALIMTTYRLGHQICRGNEALEAIFVRQMVEHGQFFALENGQSPMYKPPLFHWSGYLIDKVIGAHQVTPFNFRLPSVLYGAATVALTMAFTYPILGPGGAIIAGLTLLGEHQFVRLARIGRVDMTLTFFEMLALFGFLWWIRTLPDRESAPASAPRLYLTTAALGLAVLAKGPIGALLPGLAMFLFSISERRLLQVLRALRPGPILLGALIAAAWYLACLLGHQPAFLHRQFRENLGQFTGSTVGSSPFWFYLGPTLLSAMPFSLLAPFAVFAALFRNPRPEPGSAAARRLAEARDAVRLLAIFWLANLIFFSLAAYKSRWYMLPLWPPSAVLIAWGVAGCAARWNTRWLPTAFAGVCIAAMAFNLILIPREERHDCLHYSYRPVAAAILRTVKPSAPLYAAGFNDEDFAPLLFYLGRDAPFIGRDLKHAPEGFIIATGSLWHEQKVGLPGFAPVIEFSEGRRKPVLLWHGNLSAGVGAPELRKGALTTLKGSE